MSPTLDISVHDAILDSIVDGIFTVDNRWRITSLNRAAERITGVSRDEAFGRSCCDVFQSSVCGSACALKETLRTGKPIIDKLVYLSNGNGKIPVSITTTALRDEFGRVIGAVQTLRDLRLVDQARADSRVAHTFAGIIGRSPVMQRLFDVLPQFAQSNSTVLIDGPSGTGKELFARAIHELSERSSQRFVAVNCGALPDTLLESELFGYKAGAFTDARHDKPGRFSLADGGTIFLDEIGDVSRAMQTKLLRVLQERVFEPLGSVDSLRVDVRVIAATNKDLGQLVSKGLFRDDLYYRVNIAQLRLPPLSQRREDIPLLVDHFLDKFNRSQDKRVLGVSEDVLSLLLTYDYPGNVRELENIIEHAFVLCRRGLIEKHHLPAAFRERIPEDESHGHNGLTLRALEVIHIRDALRRCGGNRTAAARQLGIDPSTLFRKIKSLQIPLPEGDGRCRD
jgi:PAS domain S-box-containing protein